MTGWKAWYTEGRTYESGNDSWQELPGDGVLAVLIFEEMIPGGQRRYRKILQGGKCEWYFMLGDSIVCSPDSKQEILERYPEARHLKRGKWTTDLTFEDVIEQAQTQPCGC